MAKRFEVNQGMGICTGFGSCSVENNQACVFTSACLCAAMQASCPVACRDMPIYTVTTADTLRWARLANRANPLLTDATLRVTQHSKAYSLRCSAYVQMSVHQDTCHSHQVANR